MPAFQQLNVGDKMPTCSGFSVEVKVRVEKAEFTREAVLATA